MGKLFGPAYKNKAKILKKTRLSKRRLPLFTLKLRRPVDISLTAPIVQYRMPSINKSYMISTLPTHTWSYTSPDLVLGSYIRMVSGVFMQKGNMLSMLRLFKHFKNLTDPIVAAHSNYKIVEPSFPAQVLPVALSFKRRPLQMASFSTTPIGPKKLDGVPTSVCPKLGPKINKVAAFSGKGRIKFSKGSGVLNFRKKPSRLPCLPRPSKFKITLRGAAPFSQSLAFNTSGVGFSYPKQNSFAVWNLLYQQPLLNYSLKYCRLSRRVRKILKNKYRYSKYYFVIAPYKRRLFTLHL